MAAKGGMKTPPKLLPAVTAPITLPRVSGYHAATNLPEGKTVVPGNPAKTNALKKYHSHKFDIKGLSPNPKAIIIMDTIITGLIPILSDNLPDIGAIILDIKAIDKPRFNSVWVQPNFSIRGKA